MYLCAKVRRSISKYDGSRWQKASKASLEARGVKPMKIRVVRDSNWKGSLKVGG